MRRRVLLSLALAAAMTLGVTASAQLAGHVFPDVPDDHVFAKGIEWAKDNALVAGYLNGNFGPEDNVTRGQLVTIFKRYHDNLAGTGGGGTGPQGPQGEPGLALVAQRITEEHPVLTGIRVVDVPGGESGYDDFTVQLFPSVDLAQGTYLAESTVQFFDFTGNTTEGIEYGLARAFLDGVALGTTWTADIPDDGDNAAQGSGSLLIDVPAGGGTLSVMVLIRGEDGEGLSAVAGHAGGNLIVTQFNG